MMKVQDGVKVKTYKMFDQSTANHDV